MVSAIIPNTESYETEKEIKTENDTKEGQINLIDRPVEENKNKGMVQIMQSRNVKKIQNLICQLVNKNFLITR